jgi:hypothetical protein
VAHTAAGIGRCQALRLMTAVNTTNAIEHVRSRSELRFQSTGMASLSRVVNDEGEVLNMTDHQQAIPRNHVLAFFISVVDWRESFVRPLRRTQNTARLCIS